MVPIVVAEAIISALARLVEFWAMVAYFSMHPMNYILQAAHHPIILAITPLRVKPIQGIGFRFTDDIWM